MTNTTYYNLNIVEGTDIVNPLTVDNPNYEKIDETMHNNAVSGVTLATEITNATVHAITRENSECAVIRFIATSAWKAGDTATVDGVPVTTLLPSGEVLPDGAYVINANVLCILTGSNMTVFAERKKTDTANDIQYNDTNVGAELDKVNRNLNAIENFSIKPSATEEVNIGKNRYMKLFKAYGELTLNVWAAFADLSSYRNIEVDYGRSFVESEGSFYYMIDANITGISVRYNFNTNALEYYCNTNGAKSSNVAVCVYYSK